MKTDGYPWNDNNAALSIITKSCHIINDRLKTRLPIRIGLLELMLFDVGKHFGGQPYLNRLYQAIFSIAYYGLMRIGEMTAGTHPVKASDVHIGQNKNKILLLLRTSKTHGKESRPQKIKIQQTFVNKARHFCPFDVLHRFMTYRGGYELDSEIFFIYSDGMAVTPEHVKNTMRTILQCLGLDPVLYDTMSFHSGRAVDMYHMCYTLTQIKQAGCWKSNAIFKYLKL